MDKCIERIEVLEMQGRVVRGWWSRSGVSGTGSLPSRKQQQLRHMVTLKASNRAAVHGTRPPVPDQIDKEEVQKDVSKAKEEKENKRKEMEKTVDSEIKKPDKPYSPVE